MIDQVQKRYRMHLIACKVSIELVKTVWFSDTASVLLTEGPGVIRAEACKARPLLFH